MSLREKISKFFIGYSFVRNIDEGQFYNSNILVRRNIDKTLWVGKISRRLPKILTDFYGPGKNYVRTVDFMDLNDRALLGSRLASLAGLKVLRVKIIKNKLISDFNVNSLNFSLIDENIFLSEYRGVSLPKYLLEKKFVKIEDSDIENKNEIFFSFVFRVWIGCYDCKDEDFLVDENKNIIPIDFHLFGPGFRSSVNLAVGAWGEAFDITNSKDTGWCAGGDIILEYIRSKNLPISSYEIFIDKINSIKEKEIKATFSGLNLYEQGTEKKINLSFYDFLLDRRKKLKQTIEQWINSDYGKTNLPKNNGII